MKPGLLFKSQRLQVRLRASSSVEAPAFVPFGGNGSIQDSLICQTFCRHSENLATNVSFQPRLWLHQGLGAFFGSSKTAPLRRLTRRWSTCTTRARRTAFEAQRRPVDPMLAIGGSTDQRTFLKVVYGKVYGSHFFCASEGFWTFHFSARNNRVFWPFLVHFSFELTLIRSSWGRLVHWHAAGRHQRGRTLPDASFCPAS